MAVQALQVVLWEWSASQAGMVVLTMWWWLLLTVAASRIYPDGCESLNVANVETVLGSDFCLISLAVTNGRVASQSVTSALRNTFNIFQFSCDWKASQLVTVLISTVDTLHHSRSKAAYFRIEPSNNHHCTIHWHRLDHTKTSKIQQTVSAELHQFPLKTSQNESCFAMFHFLYIDFHQ